LVQSFSTWTLPVRLNSLLQPNLVVLSNATATIAGFLVTSVLGFGFWWVAAKFFSPEAVGLGSTAVAVMSLVGLIGEFGLGTLLLEELPRQRGRAAPLIVAAVAVACCATAVLTVGYVVLTSGHISSLGSLTDSPLGASAFVLGAVLTCAALVLDSALLGLLRGGLQFWRNGIFAAAKLIFLVIAALLVTGHPGELLIYISWTLGNLISFLWLARAARAKLRITARFDILRSFGGKFLAHHLLNIVTTIPGLLLPVLVTTILSARAAGAFYAAWMLVSFAFLLPAAFTRVLFTVGIQEPGRLAERMRFTLRISIISGIGAAVGFGLLADLGLRIFGANYAEIAASGLQVLGCAALSQGIKHHFIAVERLRGRTVPAAAYMSGGAALEIGLAALGAELGGLTGLCVGWVLGTYLEAIFMLPAIRSVTKRL
jgi:O-antigen/teichoic acid export membrane protein